MLLQPTNKDFARDILKGFEKESFLDKFKEKTGVNLDFTIESLRAYSIFLNKEYPKGALPSAATLMIISVYYGETIVKNIKNASWSMEPFKNPTELKIVVSYNNQKIVIDNEELSLKEQVILPVKTISNFFIMGEKTLDEEFQKIKEMA